jgi:hypothetical protein
VTTSPRGLIANARDEVATRDHGIASPMITDLCDALEQALDRVVAHECERFAYRGALQDALAREATAEEALRQRPEELKTLRSRVGDLQASNTALIERARKAEAR